MTRWLGLLLAVACASGQTKVDLQNQSKSVDFSAAPATKPARVVTAIPAACGTGEFAFLSAAPPGQNLYLCAAANTWVQVAGGGGSSGSTRSQVTSTAAAITMAPGAVWASGAQNVYSTSATVSVTGGTDTGLFTIGYNAAGQRVCYYGTGINPANYSVAGFAGNTCTPAPSSGFVSSATVVMNAGAFQTPLDLRADSFEDTLTCGSNLVPVTGGGCGVDPTTALNWTGQINFAGAAETATIRSGLSNPATCNPGDLFVNTNAGPALEFCSSANTWAQIH